MNLISNGFLVENGMLTWSEIAVLLDKGLIKNSACVDIAANQLGTNSDELLVELACLDPDEPISPLVEKLVKRESQEVDELKVLKLVLKWIYENREKLDDPLGKLEEVYADFNYPSSISHLVRYMPNDSPDLGSIELNESKMVSELKKFVYSHES